MSDRFPILFTIPNFITAGSGRAMLNIVERLDRSRFAPAVCVSKRGGALDAEVERLGFPLLVAPFTVPIRPYHTFPFRAWKAAQVFRPFRFCLWHSFHYSDDYTEPIIARMAGARAWVYTKKNMMWGRRAWWLRTLFASRVIALNTDMMSAFFRYRWTRKKTRLIPRGIDTTRFIPDAAPVLQIRKNYDLPQDAVVAACVAQFVPVKDQVTLLRALVKVPDLYLVLAGSPTDATYAASLRRLASELKLQARVRFLGSVKDVAALHAEMDLFVLTTAGRGEGLSVAHLEAMACGKACLVTDVPGSRDLVEQGVTGVLAPPENPEALAAALRELAANPGWRKRMGAAARQLVVARHRIEDEAAAHQALYEELLLTCP